MSTTVSHTIEYRFYVNEVGWEMLFSVDYEYTPGESDDRREIGYSLGTPASEAECVVTGALLLRIDSDVMDDMGKFNFLMMGLHRPSAEATLFGKWFLNWIETDEDDRVRLHEACLEHARGGE